MSELEEWCGRYRSWFIDAALPLWSPALDASHPGFQEKLDRHGAPLDLPRRTRVQARQVFVYANAARFGWNGPWGEACRQGLDALRRNYRRPDGLYRALASPDGRPLDDTAYLYDQAFVLLAFANAHGRAGDLRADADALRTAVERNLRHPVRGFVEADHRPYQANAQMHLLEASLAWIAAGGGDAWRAVADEIVALALDAFVEPQTGALREAFDSDWRPVDDGGDAVEPGHQFEWAWLLSRWIALGGDPAVQATAERLYATGRRGVSPGNRIAVQALDRDLSIVGDTARLWPQTEWIKAAKVFGDKVEVAQAASALWRFLQTDTPGLWRDRLQPDGTFVDEPAPASSLYHIAGAVAALCLDDGLGRP